jgi:two-component system response regulator YesN
MRVILAMIRVQQNLLPTDRQSMLQVGVAMQIALECWGSVQMNLKGLSREVFVSKGYLAVLFRRATGLHFRQYLRSLRITLAAELLTASDALVVEIAALLGHKSGSNFAREFRAEIGVTPEHFRDLRLPNHSRVFTAPT